MPWGDKPSIPSTRYSDGKHIARGLTFSADGALAKKIVAGTVTARDLLAGIDNRLGIWWFVCDEGYSIEDSMMYAEGMGDPNYSVKGLAEEGDFEDGEVCLVVIAKRPMRNGEPWDPEKHNESQGLMGNSHLEDGERLDLVELMYDAGWGWKSLPAQGLRATAGAEGDLPEGLTFEMNTRATCYGDTNQPATRFTAHLPGRRMAIGSLVVAGKRRPGTNDREPEGTISYVWVDAAHRRKGIAKALLAYARQHMEVRHGWTVTDAGKGFARAVAAKDEGITYRYDFEGVVSGVEHRSIAALDGDRQIGFLDWDVLHGQDRWPPVISNIRVEPEYRRRGIATQMLRMAREISPTLVHAQEHARTRDGLAWSRVVGSILRGVDSEHDGAAAGDEQGSGAAGRGGSRRHAGPASGRIGRGRVLTGVTGRDARKPRPVLIEGPAKGDFARLDEGWKKKAAAAMRLLQEGKAMSEPKERPPLLDCFSMRIGNTFRVVFFIGIDGAYHVFYLGFHDYAEAERRMGAKSQVMYHVTKPSNRDSIRELGLLTDYKGRLWLYPTRELAQAHIDTFAHWGPQDLWEVDITGMRTSKDPHEIAAGAGGRIVKQPVPPERVRLLTGTTASLQVEAVQGVKAYHGTSEVAWNRMLVEGFKPQPAIKMVHAMEDEFGLPRGSLWKEQGWSRHRRKNKTDKHFYLTTDYETAVAYSHAGSAPLYDALQQAFRKTHPEAYKSGFFPYWEGESEWIAKEITKRVGRPIVVEFDLPPSEVFRADETFKLLEAGWTEERVLEWVAGRGPSPNDAELGFPPEEARDLRKYVTRVTPGERPRVISPRRGAKIRGVDDPDVVRQFMRADCVLLAQALARANGWGVTVVGDHHFGNIWHAWARRPDGTLIDVQGEHPASTAQTLAQRHRSEVHTFSTADEADEATGYIEVTGDYDPDEVAQSMQFEAKGGGKRRLWHLTTNPEWVVKPDFQPVDKYPEGKTTLFLAEKADTAFWLVWVVAKRKEFNDKPVWAVQVEVSDEYLVKGTREYRVRPGSDARVMKIVPASQVVPDYENIMETVRLRMEQGYRLSSKQDLFKEAASTGDPDLDHALRERKPIYRGVHVTLEADEYERWLGSYRDERAKILLDLVDTGQRNRSKHGLGRHWTYKGEAEGRAWTHDIAPTKQPDGTWKVCVVIEAASPDPAHVESDKDTLRDHGVAEYGAEYEMPLKIGAPVQVRAIHWNEGDEDQDDGTWVRYPVSVRKTALKSLTWEYEVEWSTRRNEGTGLEIGTHTFVVEVDADTPTEAQLLAHSMVDSGLVTRRERLDDGMVTRLTLISVRPTGTPRIAAGMHFVVPDSHDGPLYRGVGFIVEGEDEEFIFDPSKPMGARAERAVKAFEAWRKTGRGGLGRHWSTERNIGRHFGLMSASTLASEAKMMGGTAVGMLITILPPDPEDYERDQRVLNERGVTGGENEITLRPGAEVKINGVEWWDATDYKRKGEIIGAPGHGIAKRAVSWSRGKHLYRGYQVDFPPDIEAEIRRLTAGAMTEDEIDQEMKVGQIVVDYLMRGHQTPYGRVNLGRHWSSNRMMAEIAAQQGAPGKRWGVILEIKDEGQETDPDATMQGDFYRDNPSEQETNLRPGTPVTITGVYFNHSVGIVGRNENVLAQPLRRHAASSRAGIEVERVRVRREGIDGFVAKGKGPQIAYRGFGSWAEAKDAQRNRGWMSEGMFTVRGEGATQMALRLGDVLKGSGYHSLRFTGFLGAIEADVSGLAFQSFISPTGDLADKVKIDADGNGIIRPDLGLGIGINDPIPLDRIRKVFRIENQKVVQTWTSWEAFVADLPSLEDNPGWTPEVYTDKTTHRHWAGYTGTTLHCLTRDQGDSLCGKPISWDKKMLLPYRAIIDGKVSTDMLPVKAEFRPKPRKWLKPCPTCYPQPSKPWVNPPPKTRSRSAWGSKGSKTAALSLEDRISVAEQAMERGGLAGKRITMPTGRNDDPAYQAAIEPLVDWVSGLVGHRIRFYASDYTLDQHGAQAMTDGYNKIVVRQVTTEMTVLHEVAHCINGTQEGEGHDAQFARLLRDLYRKHLGPAAADAFWNLVGPSVDPA